MGTLISADTHVHSHHSGDSEEDMESMVRAAGDKGLRYLCFTEHMDMDYPELDCLPPDYFTLDTEAYSGEFTEIYEANIHDGTYALDLGFGVELGLQPQIADRLQDYVDYWDFDYIIGSVHIAGGRDPYLPEYYEGRTVEEAVRAYFRAEIDCLEAFHDFDSLGHLDYIIRYAPGLGGSYDWRDYQVYIDEILRMLVRYGIALEINTGSLSKGSSSMSPCEGVVRRYRELGGELVTIGSDAHRAGEIGRYLYRARKMLARCGFTRYAAYRDRNPIMMKLV